MNTLTTLITIPILLAPIKNATIYGSVNDTIYPQYETAIEQRTYSGTLGNAYTGYYKTKRQSLSKFEVEITTNIDAFYNQEQNTTFYFEWVQIKHINTNQRNIQQFSEIIQQKQFIPSSYVEETTYHNYSIFYSSQDIKYKTPTEYFTKKIANSPGAFENELNGATVEDYFNLFGQTSETTTDPTNLDTSKIIGYNENPEQLEINSLIEDYETISTPTWLGDISEYTRNNEFFTYLAFIYTTYGDAPNTTYKNALSRIDILELTNIYDYITPSPEQPDPEQPIEVIDIPGLLFSILAMPFGFISIAFDLTLFPGTAYEINIANLLLVILAILIILAIIIRFVRR